jgi:SAM-dependent MidA family methyltransferase
MANAPAGTIVETSPASVAAVREIAQRLKAQGGAALIADYGHERSATGDTLQAVAKHGFADPWSGPGEKDLTAHVDFEALGKAARDEGAKVVGPRPQGPWLEAMGIGLRAKALAEASPEHAEEIEKARDRLVSKNQMGNLFKVMALAAPFWPDPAGFA